MAGRAAAALTLFLWMGFGWGQGFLPDRSRRYVSDNHVEDVFLRGAELPPFLDEQIDLMRRMLREAGVQ